MQQPTQTKKKPKPIVAIIAVLVPLLVLVVAATVSQRSANEGSASATTLVQDGDPEASGDSGKNSDEGDKTSTTAKDEGKDQEADASDEAQDEVPSAPADAGPEGERTSVTYPQPTVPAGGCSRPSGPVVITLGEGPDPACLELAADQPITVRNRTGKEISFIAISVNEVVSAGSELSIGTAGSAFGEGQSTFWSPGNPQLSGIVVVG